MQKLKKTRGTKHNLHIKVIKGWKLDPAPQAAGGDGGHASSH